MVRSHPTTLLLFRVYSLHISNLHSFPSTALSLSQTSNTSSGPPKKKIDLQTLHLNRLPFFNLRIHRKSALQQIFRRYYTYSIQKLRYTTKATQVTAATLRPTWYSNTISDSCPPKLDGEKLPSRSGTQPNQLNMKILMLMFSWPFLATVLVNVFLWPVSATQVV